MTPTLHIIGVPLNEEEALAASAVAVLETCQVIIAESSKIGSRLLKGVSKNATRFFLDKLSKLAEEDLAVAIKDCSKSGANVGLISDTGMPILFDPGNEVLSLCRKLGFSIRTSPGPTSFSTAMAVSGYDAPFYIVGFLPQKTEDRKRAFNDLKKQKGHLVFLETPYRFTTLLKEVKEAFGPQREIFLAWEIAKPNETYLWGKHSEIESQCARKGFTKGEFILIIKG